MFKVLKTEGLARRGEFACPHGTVQTPVFMNVGTQAAIKGGQRNSPAELLKVAQAVMSGAVKYCPHGRPVAIELTRQQLEKRFGRA